MTEEEFKVLGEKIKNKSATSEEFLAYLKELNVAMKSAKQILDTVKK